MRIYEHGNDILLCACDENLLGKKFKEGKFQIDVAQNFYNGNRVDKKTLQQHLENATIANLVGKETVESALEAGVINSECVLRIDGVPHAQMARMM